MYAQRKKVHPSTYFLVLQLVTNRGLYSVPGRTKWYLEAPWQAYWGPDGASRYHLVLNRILYLWQAGAPKIGAWKYLFFLECNCLRDSFVLFIEGDIVEARRWARLKTAPNHQKALLWDEFAERTCLQRPLILVLEETGLLSWSCVSSCLRTWQSH